MMRSAESAAGHCARELVAWLPSLIDSIESGPRHAEDPRHGLPRRSYALLRGPLHINDLNM
jgi:hypothetical protein